jgi:uncharacterized membrane protein YsdA (DUF1294 family)
MPASRPEGVMRARIIEWDAPGGFGYVDHAGNRLFLHRRDFVRPDARPRAGDVVAFVIGTDGKGRPCARAVESVACKRSLRLRDWLGWLGLLVLPALGILHLPWPPGFAAAWVAGLSLATFLVYRFDKSHARRGRWQVPEPVLHFLGILGGWPGAYLARLRYRHKTTHPFFRFVFWLIVLSHEALALDCLLGWPAGARVVEWVAGAGGISQLPP